MGLPQREMPRLRLALTVYLPSITLKPEHLSGLAKICDEYYI